MVTKRKSEFQKARGDTRRAFGRMVAALPMVARLNWRNIVMPWRMLPAPVAMALIALVALAMVLDNGEHVDAQPIGGSVTIGADTVPPDTHCAEDEVITYRALIGREGVGCVHYEYVVMEFLDDCIIGNSVEHPRVTPNLATLHLRDPEFGSWCSSVVDDVSDGIVSLGDLLLDVNTLPGYPGHVPAETPVPTVSPDSTVNTGKDTMPTAILPKSLPSTGSR